MTSNHNSVFKIQNIPGINHFAQMAFCTSWSRDKLSVNTFAFRKFCYQELKGPIKIRKPVNFRLYISKEANGKAADN